MKRTRDAHPRLREDIGRLSAVQAIRQDLSLAHRELELALNADDVKTVKEHAGLARKFLSEVVSKLKRIK